MWTHSCFNACLLLAQSPQAPKRRKLSSIKTFHLVGLSKVRQVEAISTDVLSMPAIGRNSWACQHLFCAVHFFYTIGRFRMQICMPLLVEQLLLNTVNTPMQLQCIMSLNMNVHQMFGLVHSLISFFMRGKTKFYSLQTAPRELVSIP